MLKSIKSYGKLVFLDYKMIIATIVLKTRLDWPVQPVDREPIYILVRLLQKTENIKKIGKTYKTAVQLANPGTGTVKLFPNGSLT